MLKLKLRYFGHLMGRTDSLEKTLMLGKIEGRRRRGWQYEMVGWHHWLNGHEFEQALGAGDGQGSLACCSPWGCKESDTTARPNWTEWFKSNLKDQRGFPGGSADKESACDTGDPGLIPGLGRSPRRREWLPIPVSWPREFHGLYSPWGCKELGIIDQLSLSRTNTGTHKLTVLYMVCQVHVIWTWTTWQFDYFKGVKYWQLRNK